MLGPVDKTFPSPAYPPSRNFSLAPKLNSPFDSKQVLDSDTFTSSSSAAWISNDTDRPGLDFMHFLVKSYEECEVACAKRADRCTSWSYAQDQVCWLKEGISRPITKNKVVSGIFPGRYVCS